MIRISINILLTAKPVVRVNKTMNEFLFPPIDLLVHIIEITTQFSLTFVTSAIESSNEKQVVFFVWRKSRKPIISFCFQTGII